MTTITFLTVLVAQVLTFTGIFFMIVNHNPAYLPPCPTEDSMNCFWDATLQGNHQGQSFVDILGWTFTK